MNYPPPLPAPKLNLIGRTTLNAMRLTFQIGGRLAPTASAKYAHKLYFSPRRYPAGQKEKKVLQSSEPFSVPFKSRQNVPYPGGDLKAFAWGKKGPMVLLLHGWESRGSWMAEPFLEPLQKAGFRVVTLDMPGHGQSPGTQSEVLDFTNAISAVEKMAGPFHAVIAHSLGAAATSIACTEGLTVNKLVYFGPVCWMLSLPERFCHILKLPKTCQNALYKELYKTHTEEEWLKYSGHVVSKQLKTPGLIFHDRNDTEVHHEGATAIHQVWRQSELVLTEGLGHRRLIRDKGAIAKTLKFIA